MIEIDPDLFGKKVVYINPNETERNQIEGFIRGVSASDMGIFYFLIEKVSGGFHSVFHTAVIRILD